MSDLGLSYLPRLTIPVLQLCPTFLSKDTTFNASFLSRVQFSYTKTETISNSTRETSTAQPAYWDVDGRLPLKEFTNIEVVNSRYFRFSQYDDYDYYDYYLNPINYNFINKKNGFCNKGGICNISSKNITLILNQGLYISCNDREINISTVFDEFKTFIKTDTTDVGWLTPNHMPYVYNEIFEEDKPFNGYVQDVFQEGLVDLFKVMHVLNCDKTINFIPENDVRNIDIRNFYLMSVITYNN